MRGNNESNAFEVNHYLVIKPDLCPALMGHDISNESNSCLLPVDKKGGMNASDILSRRTED